jgi:hypothetical protein
LTTSEHHHQQEATTNKDTAMMSVIIHDFTMALEESGDTDALVTMIKGWQSSMETFQDALWEHSQMDTTAGSSGSRDKF